MTKYGFDYFVKRSENLYEDVWLLDEAARGKPSPWMKILPAGPVLKEIGDQISNKMMHGGDLSTTDLITGEPAVEHVAGLGGGRHTNKALRYLLYTITGMDRDDSDDENVDDKESSKEIVGQACRILGIPKEGWSLLRDEKGNKRFLTPDALYRAALLKAITDYGDYIQSPEYKQKALDANNILEFAKSNRLTTAASHAKSEKRGQLQGGMSQEEMDSIETGIKPVITQIKRAEFNKRRRKNPQQYAQQAQETGQEESNDFIDDSYLITDALEIAIENVNDVRNTVDDKAARLNSRNVGSPDQIAQQEKRNLQIAIDEAEDYYKGHYTPDQVNKYYYSNVGTLKVLLDHYSNQHDVGVDLDKFRKQMEKIDKSNPRIANTIDILLYEIKELQKLTDSEDTLTGEPSQESSKEFGGYSPEITDKFLTTPDLRQKFKQYLNYMINVRQSRADAINQELEMRKSGGYMDDAESAEFKKAADAFLGPRYQQHKDKNKKPTMKQKEEEAAFDADSYTPTDYDYPEEDEEAPSVMGYMTEQISKDRFKSKGEFKDRGFKKLSYHDWIVKYQ